MSKHDLPDLPTKKELEKLGSEDLASLSATLTDAKDQFHTKYKERQEKLHGHIAEAQQREQAERIEKDPDYWNKHQGIK